VRPQQHAIRDQAERLSAKHFILSIDLGSSGPKVALVGEDGAIAASAVRSVRTIMVPPAGAEQDAEEIWSAIESAATQVVREAGVPADSILGVATASQYFSVVPIDASGLPVSNLVLWLDGRGGPYSEAIHEHHPEAFARWVEINGMPPLPTGSDSLSHTLFIKNERPEVYERAFKFVEPMDYVTARLTGSCTANPCTAFAQLITDNRDLGAVRYHEELLDLSGIDREKLPDLVPVGSDLGPIRKDVADRIGLSPNTRIFAGVNDTQAASIGAGSFQKGHGGISVGTTCQVLAFVDTMRTDIDNSILSMPSPIPGRYMVMAENGLAGKTLEHFLGSIAFANDALGDHAAADPFHDLEALLRSIPAGSGSLLYLPWLTGSMYPSANPAMRGGFLNLSLETTRAHMLRAVLEGVTFNLRWLLPVVERFAEQQFDDLRFVGGGAVSDEWSQIFSDVMNRPVHQLAEARQVNTRAIAFLAFEKLGIAALDDIQKFCRIARTYEPKAGNRGVYEALFGQFVAAYHQNRPIFEALNAGA
jgi:xylulokinase